MVQDKKKVAVIGSGISGIIAIAIMKEEGHDVICFEKTDMFGGTWYYRNYSIEGVGSTMATTIINHSKEIGALSNFPPRKEYNNYMRHRELFQYIKEYAEHNKCLKHVRYNTEVISVKKAEDYEESGQWLVAAKDTLSGKMFTDIFDAVMVCTGHMNRPKMVTFPGQDNFKGKIMHTHSLKEVMEFKEQNVIVVGMGCSAMDAAVETSIVANQVYMSTRSGGHILQRLGPYGYPLDYMIFRRYLTIFLDILPPDLCSWYLETVYLDPKFDHRLLAVKPKYHLFSKDPIISDQIASKLLSGSVIQRNIINHFVENGVVFEGENEVTEADAVIFATGYIWKFPFLEDGLLTEEDGRINLYKCMHPPHLKHSSLAFIGFVNSFGALFPLAEMQCRWAAYLLSGKAKLPSLEEMMKDIKKRHYNNLKRFAPSDRQTIRVDYVQYQDELTSLFGVKPNLLKLLLADPRLFFRLCFGSSVAYQYRLEGPHKWIGAREAILSSDERMLWPLLRSKDRKSLWQCVLEYLPNLLPKNLYIFRA